MFLLDGELRPRLHAAFGARALAFCPRKLISCPLSFVLLVGADSSRVFRDSIPPSKQNRLGNRLRTMCNIDAAGSFGIVRTHSLAVGKILAVHV